jgi:hypothetical protein
MDEDAIETVETGQRLIIREATNRSKLAYPGPPSRLFSKRTDMRTGMVAGHPYPSFARAMLGPGLKFEPGPVSLVGSTGLVIEESTKRSSRYPFSIQITLFHQPSNLSSLSR